MVGSKGVSDEGEILQGVLIELWFVSLGNVGSSRRTYRHPCGYNSQPVIELQGDGVKSTEKGYTQRYDQNC